MRAGRMDRIITLKSRTLIGQDAYGSELTTWSEAETWAERRELRGAERFAAQQVVSELSARYYLHYREDIDEKDLLVDGDTTYEIHAVLPLGRREGVEIYVVSQPGIIDDTGAPVEQFDISERGTWENPYVFGDGLYYEWYDDTAAVVRFKAASRPDAIDDGDTYHSESYSAYAQGTWQNPYNFGDGLFYEWYDSDSDIIRVKSASVPSAIDDGETYALETYNSYAKGAWQNPYEFGDGLFYEWYDDTDSQIRVKAGSAPSAIDDGSVIDFGTYNASSKGSWENPFEFVDGQFYEWFDDTSSLLRVKEDAVPSAIDDGSVIEFAVYNTADKGSWENPYIFGDDDLFEWFDDAIGFKRIKIGSTPSSISDGDIIPIG